MADHVGNVGDELNKQAGNLGDDLDTTADRAADTGKDAWRKADGDESLADKIGNAGDDMRRTVDDKSYAPLFQREGARSAGASSRPVSRAMSHSEHPDETAAPSKATAPRPISTPGSMSSSKPLTWTPSPTPWSLNGRASSIGG